ncbi:hypothetical protein K504DRAFT_448614 [Pleomassaria siparia CBS 279.74]|uniref:Uncharacterized protein n=1 Tax=Pleomassaria siparia CBS 279.74 TaxID=1314801 RepID=A0A6G1JZG7_9PLEO|nr:hypothetical protein K504DRAFT_448614 [Pleomassaria siparia CBS 279.74]
MTVLWKTPDSTITKAVLGMAGNYEQEEYGHGFVFSKVAGLSNGDEESPPGMELWPARTPNPDLPMEGLKDDAENVDSQNEDPDTKFERSIFMKMLMKTRFARPGSKNDSSVFDWNRVDRFITKGHKSKYISFSTSKNHVYIVARGIWLVEAIIWYSKLCKGPGEFITPSRLREIGDMIKRAELQTFYHDHYPSNELHKIPEDVYLKDPMDGEVLQDIAKQDPGYKDAIHETGNEHTKTVYVLDIDFRSFQAVHRAMCLHDWEPPNPMKRHTMFLNMEWMAPLSVRKWGGGDITRVLKAFPPIWRQRDQPKKWQKVLEDKCLHIGIDNIVFSSMGWAWSSPNNEEPSSSTTNTLLLNEGTMRAYLLAAQASSTLGVKHHIFAVPRWLSSESEDEIREFMFGPDSIIMKRPYHEIFKYIQGGTLLILVRPPIPFRQYLSIWAAHESNGYPAAILCETVDSKTTSYDYCDDEECAKFESKNFFTPCRHNNEYCKDPISRSVQAMMLEKYEVVIDFGDAVTPQMPELTLYVRKRYLSAQRSWNPDEELDEDVQ